MLRALVRMWENGFDGLGPGNLARTIQPEEGQAWQQRHEQATPAFAWKRSASVRPGLTTKRSGGC
jgi:hypothetical protein